MKILTSLNLVRIQYTQAYLNLTKQDSNYIFLSTKLIYLFIDLNFIIYILMFLSYNIDVLFET